MLVAGFSYNLTFTYELCMPHANGLCWESYNELTVYFRIAESRTKYTCSLLSIHDLALLHISNSLHFYDAKIEQLVVKTKRFGDLKANFKQSGHLLWCVISNLACCPCSSNTCLVSHVASAERTARFLTLSDVLPASSRRVHSQPPPFSNS